MKKYSKIQKGKYAAPCCRFFSAHPRTIIALSPVDMSTIKYATQSDWEDGDFSYDNKDSWF